MKIKIIDYPNGIPNETEPAIYLRTDEWDDFGFSTLFHLHIRDTDSEVHSIGDIKIAFKNQDKDVSTLKKLKKILDINDEQLTDEFYSLGQDERFYSALYKMGESGKKILNKLNDLALSLNEIDEIVDEDVFRDSLLRYISLSTVKGKFHRIINGKPELENYYFAFNRHNDKSFGDIDDMVFDVRTGKLPSNNIHAIIGRNGVGKTTLLKDFVKATLDGNDNVRLLDMYGDRVEDGYFSRVISISFSAFDSFVIPELERDQTTYTRHHYIGLRRQGGEDEEVLKNSQELREDAKLVFKSCFERIGRSATDSYSSKTGRLLNALCVLNSDPIFKSRRFKYEVQQELLEQVIQKVSNILAPF